MPAVNLLSVKVLSPLPQELSFKTEGNWFKIRLLYTLRIKIFQKSTNYYVNCNDIVNKRHILVFHITVLKETISDGATSGKNIGTPPRNFCTVPKLFWDGTPYFQRVNITMQTFIRHRCAEILGVPRLPLQVASARVKFLHRCRINVWTVTFTRWKLGVPN